MAMEVGEHHLQQLHTIPLQGICFESKDKRVLLNHIPKHHIRFKLGDVRLQSNLHHGT